MYSRLILIILVVLPFHVFAQRLSQTVKGIVSDNATNQPIPFANVSIKALNIGAMADSAGNFTIPKVPVGRYSFLISAVGYESYAINEILITSAKELYLNILLKEKPTSLSEIIIKPKVNKEVPPNSTATVSAKMLSVEEARRYTGGFDDPARLVLSFAGVSSNVGDNGIVVRGNREIAWKVLNAGRYNEFYDFQFNYKTQQVQEHSEAILIPNLSYKLEF
jgi:hypothetical protein